jgi:hypothetical protein
MEIGRRVLLLVGATSLSPVMLPWPLGPSPPAEKRSSPADQGWQPLTRSPLDRAA